MPQNVPKEFYDKIRMFHGHPFVWWIGQFTKYVFKYSKPINELIEKKKQSLGFNTGAGPIVGYGSFIFCCFLIHTCDWSLYERQNKKYLWQIIKTCANILIHYWNNNYSKRSRKLNLKGRHFVPESSVFRVRPLRFNLKKEQYRITCTSLHIPANTKFSVLWCWCLSINNIERDCVYLTLTYIQVPDYSNCTRTKKIIRVTEISGVSQKSSEITASIDLSRDYWNLV